MYSPTPGPGHHLVPAARVERISGPTQRPELTQLHRLLPRLVPMLVLMKMKKAPQRRHLPRRIC